ncbi:hypothetical protein LX32DRAFT_16525 [Colletotrichum zoysiae]|uniref:Uncharacterized protein n=1 Tax=Colletotrichum zoysiae TaxID=1216348 RepID=A0AAD9HD09_9PEZI|nr:hypothetical protein LX32DRAFT_16525 [Colletotrichum zoysiae]
MNGGINLIHFVNGLVGFDSIRLYFIITHRRTEERVKMFLPEFDTYRRDAAHPRINRGAGPRPRHGPPPVRP